MFALLSGQEVALIVGAIVLLFGAKKLPELGRSLGQGIKEFKKSSQGLLDDEDEKKEESSAKESG